MIRFKVVNICRSWSCVSTCPYFDLRISDTMLALSKVGLRCLFPFSRLFLWIFLCCDDAAAVLGFVWHAHRADHRLRGQDLEAGQRVQGAGFVAVTATVSPDRKSVVTIRCEDRGKDCAMHYVRGVIAAPKSLNSPGNNADRKDVAFKFRRLLCVGRVISFVDISLLKMMHILGATSSWLHYNRYRAATARYC